MQTRIPKAELKKLLKYQKFVSEVPESAPTHDVQTLALQVLPGANVTHSGQAFQGPQDQQTLLLHHLELVHALATVKHICPESVSSFPSPKLTKIWHGAYMRVEIKGHSKTSSPCIPLVAPIIKASKTHLFMKAL
jgi:hypothetical protein